LLPGRSEHAAGERERIRWRCRRGLLELDIVLARFLEHTLPGLDGEELEAFKQLLELPDNDLWDLVNGRRQAGPGIEGRLVAMLQQA
jgi:antitoxin CptB